MEKARKDALEMAEKAHAAKNENAETIENESDLDNSGFFTQKPIAAIPRYTAEYSPLAPIYETAFSLSNRKFVRVPFSIL